MINKSSANLSPVATKSPPTSRPTLVGLPRWLVWGFVLLIALGIGLRWVNLDGKPYWIDEAFTLLHVSGVSDREVKQRLLTGQPILNKQLSTFQVPTLANGPDKTIAHIAQTAPELPPPYFLLARSSLLWGGANPAIVRGLSLGLGLLVLPAIYWLAWELFHSPATGLASMAVVALSPYQILYAQEARPYTLWALCLLVSHALLLRAIRCQRAGYPSQQRPLLWGLYALSVAAGLYIHLLHSLVLFSQGLYSLSRERWRWRGVIWPWATTTGLGLLLYLPWMIFALINFHNTQIPENPTASAIARLLTLARSSVRALTLPFADFNAGPGSPPWALVGVMLTLAALAGVIWGLRYHWWQAESRIRAFLGLTIAVPVLTLVVADLLLGGNRLGMSRYLMPSTLSLALALGYGLIQVIRTRQRWTQAAIALLLSLSLASSLLLVHSREWWSKGPDETNFRTAAIVQQTPNPVIISDAFFIYPLALSHALKPEVTWVLVPEAQQPQLPKGYSATYLYRPSPALLVSLRSQRTLKQLGDELWQIL